MKTPNFSSDQYIDAPTLNGASALVSGDFAQAAAIFKAGLVFPEAASYGATGLSVNASLPSPFAVLFGTGILAQAHGTVTGQDTQSYSVSFSGAVPGSGSRTAYLAASYSSIQQGAFQVVGPPVGHPDYNPNFAPYTAYTQNVDSLSLAVTTTAPDNISVFELFRCTLTSSSTGVGTMDTTYQLRASGPNTLQSVNVSGSMVIPQSYAGKVINIVSGGTYTMGAASANNGLTFSFACATSASVTMQTQGGDLFAGAYGQPSSGVTSFPLGQGQAVTIATILGRYQLMDSFANQTFTNAISYTVSGNFNFTAQITGWHIAEGWGGGGGGGGAYGLNNVRGAGGGGGGYSYGAIYLTAGQVVSGTVGAGGTGGVNGTPSSGGGNGGDSLFSSLVARGGAGGPAISVGGSTVNGGAGGTATGGSFLNIQGEDGQCTPFINSGENPAGKVGRGGAAPRGGQGANNNVGNSGYSPGGGGAGGNNETPGANAPGSGAVGAWLIRW